MALTLRRPTDVIHHSDQYTSIAFGQRWRDAGVRPSTGSVGDCFDNALCESFFATLECELLDRRRFATHVGDGIVVDVQASTAGSNRRRGDGERMPGYDRSIRR